MPRRQAAGVCFVCVGAALIAAGVLNGCSPGAPSPPLRGAPPTAAASEPQSSKPHYSLGIVGYNYTDTTIEFYWVNGTGAFNLAVSNETSGGGKTACCAGWVPGTKLPQRVNVEWTRDEQRWCRRLAVLQGPVPLEPTTLEVHFYPDGHIEAAITDRYSPPRLKLPAWGAAYRNEGDVNAEKAAAIRKDELVSECRDGAFPIGSVAKQ